MTLLGESGVPFSEVSAHRATLEEAYMELTRDAVEFRAASRPGPAAEERRDDRRDHDPYRPGQQTGRDGFAQLLRAEWTKFRTVRGWVIGMTVAVLVTAGLGLFAAVGASSSCQSTNGSSSGPTRTGSACGTIPSRWDRAACRWTTASTSCASRSPGTAASPSR